MIYKYTSKSRAIRSAEVSNYKKCAAIGSWKQVLPIGTSTKLHTTSQLCSLSSTSFCLIPFQLRPPLLSSSQTISTLLNFCNSFQQLSKLFHPSSPSAQLFSPLPCSSQLSPTTLTSAHLVFTLLSSSLLASALLQLFPLLLTSASAQLISPLSQPISTFLSICTQKLLHREAFTHRKLLHTEAFTQRSFYTEKLWHTASFVHKEAFTHRNIYKQKLLHREAFTHRNFYTEQALSQRSFYTQKLLHTETFA